MDVLLHTGGRAGGEAHSNSPRVSLRDAQERKAIALPLRIETTLQLKRHALSS